MNILLVDDQPLLRQGVRSVLQFRWADVQITEAGSLGAVLEQPASIPWDIIICDLDLPDGPGLEPVVRLVRAFPNVPLLVLAGQSEAEYARRTLELGAAGYLHKDRAASELNVALDRLLAGGRYISPVLAEYLADRAFSRIAPKGYHRLSSQEYRVMLQLAEGRRVQEIAVAMNLSPKTVSTYRSRVLDKVGVSSNAELAQYCLREGLIRPGA
jgi:DNA-binding NarL/FixJ family response regulator